MPKITVRSLAEVDGLKEQAIGGAIEGADRNTRETVNWAASTRSPDAMINPIKKTADARALDLRQNDGYVAGAATFQRDSIIGLAYLLNANPNIQVLGAPFDDVWAAEFQEAVEARFTLFAESTAGYLDAQGVLPFSDLVRLAIMSRFHTGEVLATAEWDRGLGRAYSTCIQMVSPARLTNPNGVSDSVNLRRGIQYATLGKPVGYNIQNADPGDNWPDPNQLTWKFVPASKPWGRRQVIHIYDKHQPDQSRGISDLVAGMKQMKMTKKFQDITLQNAVVNASFAAAIESELPPDVLFQQMGGDASYQKALAEYMESLMAYIGSSNNIAIDGAKIPHLFPGTKLSLKPMGTPGGVGTDFETSLLRHVAAPLGLSVEEFMREFSKSNYSSLRAGMATTRRAMQAIKAKTADRFATECYLLVLEEMINDGDTPRPVGWSRQRFSDLFYQPLMKEALGACSWIGAGMPQIDELKETQAMLLRIKGGVSTFESECARLGGDWRTMFRQAKREKELANKYGLEFNLDAQKTTAGVSTQGTLADNTNDQGASQ
jgi:lambda family phage portal protein